MGYIGIIDYGAGNLMSVQNSLDYLGIKNKIATSKEEINEASSLILPGVGAFSHAMNALGNSGLIETIMDNAKQKPFLGICLGMQLLFDKSFELGETEGLGLISGEVIKIPTNEKLPQMGWNSLDISNPSAITTDISNGDYVYFVHSFMVSPADKNVLTATCDYGVSVPAMIAKDNIFACQFHPEKSGDIGMKILRSFAKLK